MDSNASHAGEDKSGICTKVVCVLKVSSLREISASSRPKVDAISSLMLSGIV